MVPLATPNSLYASIAYSEHDGVNLQALGSIGETVLLYHLRALRAASTPLSSLLVLAVSVVCVLDLRDGSLLSCWLPVSPSVANLRRRLRLCGFCLAELRLYPSKALATFFPLLASLSGEASSLRQVWHA